MIKINRSTDEKLAMIIQEQSRIILEMTKEIGQLKQTINGLELLLDEKTETIRD